MFLTSLHSKVVKTPTRLRASNDNSLQQSLQTSASSFASQTSVSCTPSSISFVASSAIRVAALAFSKSALSSRTCYFAMASSISVWYSLLCWSLAWSWAFFKPILACRRALSLATSLLVSSLFFYSDALQALLASTQRLASTRTSFQASLTHSSARKTSWIAYAKTTREYHIKGIYVYNEIVITKQTGRGLASKLTMARSLFKDIKRSGCLMCLRIAMSFGKRRGCSKALAM